MRKGNFHLQPGDEVDREELKEELRKVKQSVPMTIEDATLLVIAAADLLESLGELPWANRFRKVVEDGPPTPETYAQEYLPTDPWNVRIALFVVGSGGVRMGEYVQLEHSMNEGYRETRVVTSRGPEGRYGIALKSATEGDTVPVRTL